MGLYRRDKTWWFEFVFEGRRVRESAKTSSKSIAIEAERKHRRRLEEAANGIVKREKPRLFPLAADRWFESKTALTLLGKAYYSQYIRKLKRSTLATGSSPILARMT